MISTIEKNLSESWEESNIDLSLEKLQTGSRKIRAKSIEFIWSEVSGFLNGNIELYFSNDLDSKSLCCSFAINTENNKDDTDLFIIENNFEYMTAKYIKNGISSGKVKIIIKYL